MLIRCWKYHMHMLGEKWKVTSVPISQNESLDDLHFLEGLWIHGETKYIDVGTLVQFVVLFIFTFSAGIEILTKRISYLYCDFKNHFHIHYLINGSGLLKVDNEFTFTLACLFGDSNQLNTWEKRWALCQLLLAAPKPQPFLWANCRLGRIQRGNSSALQTLLTLYCGWPYLPQAGVCQ